MAVYLTGDLHGEFVRLSRRSFYEQEGLTKEDYLIVCGDFGGLWTGDRHDQAELDLLERRSFTTLFVDGNHENFDLLARQPVERWHGGRVHVLRPHILHLMRGEVYQFAGRRWFAMGGARSHDIAGGILERDDPLCREKARRLRRRGVPFRVNHESWWAAELPDEAEYANARANLDRCGWQVDEIVTHCAPTSVQRSLSMGYAADALTDFLEEVRARCRFRHWFFGHYHDNRALPGGFYLLYEQIVPLGREGGGGAA